MSDVRPQTYLFVSNKLCVDVLGPDEGAEPRQLPDVHRQDVQEVEDDPGPDGGELLGGGVELVLRRHLGHLLRLRHVPAGHWSNEIYPKLGELGIF